MANSAQARKRARQAEKHRQHNAGRRSMMRTELKRVLKAIESGDKAAAEGAYKAAVPLLASPATQGLTHTNPPARHQTRLNAKIHAQ